MSHKIELSITRYIYDFLKERSAKTLISMNAHVRIALNNYIGNCIRADLESEQNKTQIEKERLEQEKLRIEKEQVKRAEYEEENDFRYKFPNYKPGDLAKND